MIKFIGIKSQNTNRKQQICFLKKVYVNKLKDHKQSNYINNIMPDPLGNKSVLLFHPLGRPSLPMAMAIKIF